MKNGNRKGLMQIGKAARRLLRRIDEQRKTSGEMPEQIADRAPAASEKEPEHRGASLALLRLNPIEGDER